ncbi:MAG: type II toxin-antitoxin system VapC family toxin [Gracilimonas sp.]
MIVDTNIIIDFLKGHKEANRFIEAHKPISTSVVVVSELFAGVKSKSDMREIREFLTFVELVDVTEVIAKNAGLLRRKYLKSHGIEIPDALIAATANYLKVPVASLDKKHFSILTEDLIIPY